LSAPSGSATGWRSGAGWPDVGAGETTRGRVAWSAEVSGVGDVCAWADPNRETRANIAREALFI
jgi:hypothetical protein